MTGTSSNYYLSLFLSKLSVLVNLLICISLFSFHLHVSFSPKKFQITFSSRCWREDLWRLWGPRCHVCKADLFRWARVYCEARACVNLWYNQGYAEWTWWVWNMFKVLQLWNSICLLWIFAITQISYDIWIGGGSSNNLHVYFKVSLLKMKPMRWTSGRSRLTFSPKFACISPIRCATLTAQQKSQNSPLLLRLPWNCSWLQTS